MLLPFQQSALKKSLMQLIISAILGTAIWYVCWSILSWNTNPEEWRFVFTKEKDYRIIGFCVGLWLFVVGSMYTLITEMSERNPP